MNRKTKNWLIGFTILSVVAAAAWQLSGASLAGALRQLILKTASSSLNGTLSLGEVDFSFSGSLVAKQVSLTDNSGALVASAKTLSIDLDMTDLLARRVDIDRIRKVSFDGLLLNLSRDKDSRWNIAETLRKMPSPPSPSFPSTSSPSKAFHGQVVASNATITVALAGNRYEFKQVAGSLDFAKYPDIAMDLRSKVGSGELSAKGIWNFSGGGNVIVNAVAVDPTSFSPSVPFNGLATSSFSLSGTTANPTAAGTLKVPAGSLGNTAFSDLICEFSLIGSTLSLTGTRMNVLGGSVATDGTVALDTLKYSQKISGQNIDSSRLSDKDVQGRIQFNADVTGQGSWESANADGPFHMGSGSIEGIAFEALTGNFSKRGSNTHYYNLRVTIAGQTIYLGDADSLIGLKTIFKSPLLPGVPGIPSSPNIPKVPVVPTLPKAPTLPRLF